MKLFKKQEANMASEIVGVICKGMHIEGRMSFEGTARVDGSFKGEITTDGTLLVGEGARVEGEIHVGDIVVSGQVHGTIVAKERVELKAPAKVFGDIKTPTLIISEGVVFEGNCVMTEKTGETRKTGT